MSIIRYVLRALRLRKHVRATRDDEGRVIIDPDTGKTIHVR